MSSTLPVSAAEVAIIVMATIFVIAYPLVLGGIAYKKLAVGWKYFWFGTLIFLVFQLLTRIPLLTVLSETVLASALRTSTTFTWIWLLIEAITAGLFEEVGRYIGYRLFMSREPKTWSKAVMFGLGHEGLESMIIYGGQGILILLLIAILSSSVGRALPVVQKQAFIQQVGAVTKPGWLPGLAVWGRLWSVPLQVALSVIVLQVFRRRQIHWLFLAILLHALIDFLTAVFPQIFGQGETSELLTAGVLCMFGLLGIWVIWRLREPQSQAHTREESTNL